MLRVAVHQTREDARVASKRGDYLAFWHAGRPSPSEATIPPTRRERTYTRVAGTPTFHDVGVKHICGVVAQLSKPHKVSTTS